MDKRVLIFSPYLRYQEGIEFAVTNYFKENLNGIYGIDIQKFSAIGDSINRGNKIGIGGEVLVVFDRKLCSKDKRVKPFEWTKKERIYFEGLRIMLEMSKEICDKEKIPNLMYEGEIERGKKDLLIIKLNKVKKGIENRLKKLENIDFLSPNRF